MILERIVLHNFGPYLDRHEVDLTPEPKRPVILFGGMNGGGKTTLLSALQLVLYGRQSSIWRSADTSYDSYLRKSIHRSADPEDGAGIELNFRSMVDGAEQSIQVCRYWRVSGNSIKEMVDVFRDGDLDTVLSENWIEWIEEIIPARVAPLFFFDGEKIEEMADPAQSAQILRAAIHSLLGLDVVDQLKDDLEILERRKRKELSTNTDATPAIQREQDLTRQVEEKEERAAQGRQSIASVHNEIERYGKALRELTTRLEKEGGKLFENRHEIEQDRIDTTAKAKAVEDELRSLAAGALPLLAMHSPLSALRNSTKEQRYAANQTQLLTELDTRDEHVIKRMRSLKATKTLISEIEQFLAADRTKRRETSTPDGVTLDSTGQSRCEALLTHVLPSELAKARTTIQKLDKLELEVQTLDRKLAGLPNEEQILPLLSERTMLTEKLEEARRRHAGLEEVMRLDKGELERLQRSLELAREEMTDSMLDHEDVQRLLQHSLKARGTLVQFRAKVLEGHVQRIEKIALECFRTLMRKQKLVRDLRIDPTSFQVSLLSEQGHSIPPHKLSAGERQLLAIALLWGLARASGRPLPTVIDTPLGRLDSAHRTNLIKSYFPVASHQVILLSTDEEVDADYHQQLAPSIAKSYLLDFDDDKQETQVLEGYFWEAV